MKHPLGLLTFLAATRLAGAAFAGDAAVTPPPSVFEMQKHSKALSVTLAVVPGVVIHGMGHYYAGRAGTGLVLTMLEVGAGALIGIGASNGLDEFDKLQDDMKIPDGIGTVTRAEGMIVGGTVLFLTTWLYDLLGAPKAVGADNADLDRQAAQAAALNPIGTTAAARD